MYSIKLFKLSEQHFFLNLRYINNYSLFKTKIYKTIFKKLNILMFKKKLLIYLYHNLINFNFIQGFEHF